MYSGQERPIHRSVGVRENVRGTSGEYARAWCRVACREWQGVVVQRPLPKGQRWHLSCPQRLLYDLLRYGKEWSRTPMSAGVGNSTALFVRPGRRGGNWREY
jgi:hypothetical protein